MHIFLLGFMGSGKSHWGRLWAAAHNFNFIDLDEELEKQEQKTVAAIFETRGEDYFRQKETILLRSLTAQSNSIVSCGGGTPCFFDNMAWMNKNGLTIFLEATTQFILKNIKNEKDKRPLIKDKDDAEIIFFIEQKLKERQPYYSKAKIIFPAEDLNIDSIKKVINLSL